MRSPKHPLMVWLPRLPLFLLAATRAFACLNDYEPNEKAAAESKDLVAKLTVHELKEEWPARRDRLRAELAKSAASANEPDYQKQNDLAVALLHTGETKEAIQMLLEIEAAHPGQYRTATNLGTAYELDGDNESALRWIGEGVKRNPNSHEGSEWVHVAVLKAKLARQSDPDWLRAHTVLGITVNLSGATPELTFTEPGISVDLSGEAPRMTLPAGNDGTSVPPLEVEKALTIQLHERIQFCNPPDVIVSDLLSTLGDVIAMNHGAGAALDVYTLASKYAPPESANLDLRLAMAQDAIRHGHPRAPRATSWLSGYLLVSSPFLAILCIVAWLRNRSPRIRGRAEAALRQDRFAEAWKAYCALGIQRSSLDNRRMEHCRKQMDAASEPDAGAEPAGEALPRAAAPVEEAAKSS